MTGRARRLAQSLLPALAPVVACAVALGGLTAWAASGAAGSPARVQVTSGRVLLPYGDTRDTAAFFRISNVGGADDELVSVTSPAAGDVALGRHAATGRGTAAKRVVDSLTVPAGGTVAMSPHGVDIVLVARGTWRVGDVVPFVMDFRHSGRVRAEAVVIRPGSG
ncbi:copper chaperone PCu(A)C [Streptomyces capparidis]